MALISFYVGARDSNLGPWVPCPAPGIHRHMDRKAGVGWTGSLMRTLQHLESSAYVYYIQLSRDAGLLHAAEHEVEQIQDNKEAGLADFGRSGLCGGAVQSSGLKYGVGGRAVL